MWVDHLTLAVHHIEALDEVVRNLGLLCRPPRSAAVWGHRARRRSALSGFLELVAVSDRPRARQQTLGWALVRFLAAGEGIFRVVVGVPDLDPLSVNAPPWASTIGPQSMSRSPESGRSPFPFGLLKWSRCCRGLWPTRNRSTATRRVAFVWP